MRPRLLDLCCGVGGASVGYARAGFDVVGWDVAPQPDYPYEFNLGDVLDVLSDRDYIEGFDAVHVSPPCQGYTMMNSGHRDEWPRLIEPVRDALKGSTVPYVIENVASSPLRRDVVLCGEMFGLGVIRHRVFELGNWEAVKPAHVRHRGRVNGMRHGQWFTGPYFAVYGDGGGKGTVAQWQQAMGVTWTDSRRSIAESIPPAYTAWIGSQLIDELDSANT